VMNFVSRPDLLLTPQAQVLTTQDQTWHALPDSVFGILPHGVHLQGAPITTLQLFPYVEGQAGHPRKHADPVLQWVDRLTSFHPPKSRFATR